LGRVLSIIDRNARTRTFAYDINDNLTTETWDDGTNLTYTYDKVGNLKTSTDGSSNTTNTYGYDAIYQLVSAATSNSNVGFEYDYDEFGDRTQRKDKQGTVTSAQLDYTYNNNHQLTRLIQSGVGLSTQTIEMDYDRLSQLMRIDRTVASNPGHLITDYGYDGAGRLGSIDHKFNSSVVSNYNYGYDDGNRLSGKGGTDGISTVAYGNDNQISAVNNTTRPDEAYSFDALGIRAGWLTDAVDKRRVLNDGIYQYQYDDEGNLTEKQEIATGKVTTYTWDYRNRLMKVTSGSLVVEYGYDAEDRRVSKRVNGVVQEKYVYDGEDIALVVDAGGTIVERYLYGDGTDNVLSRTSAGGVVWSLADRQGSVVDVVDEGGNVLNHFVYDSFGNRTASTTAEFRFGYTGRELDTETGLYYYRARYYDAGLGRFISEDPIGFSAGDTNLYRYVNNSPTNYTDPSGLLISGWADDALNAADSFFAGFGNVVSFGLTNKIRSTSRIAVENQQGLLYDLGGLAGLGVSLALNPAGPGAAWAKGLAVGYETFATTFGALESTGNILKGQGTVWDALNLLPVAVHGMRAFDHAGISRSSQVNRANHFEEIPDPWLTSNTPVRSNHHSTPSNVPDGLIEATPTLMLPAGSPSNRLYNSSDAHELLAKHDTLRLELFGGKEGRLENAINIDIEATRGIKSDILTDGLGFIPSNSVTEITTFNPFIPKEYGGTGISDYLVEAARVLKPGGKITISGESSNKFASLVNKKNGKIKPSNQELLDKLGLEIQDLNISLPKQYQHLKFYKYNEGQYLDEILHESIKTTILVKK
jgi:RHS repeat-associated protein